MSTSSSSFVKRQIPELESIRGLAALLVALFHAPLWYVHKERIAIIANGYLMVDLFFVLSGFVICWAYCKNIKSATQFWRFEFLRFGRIYPVHITILSLMLITSATPLIDINWTIFSQQLLLIQSIGPWGNPSSFNFPAWSISVEFYTYALFGLIILYAKKRASIIFICIALFSICLLRPSKDHGLNEIIPGYSLLLRCWSGFYIGAIGALIAQKKDWSWPSITSSFSLIALILFLQLKPNGYLDPLIYPISVMLILSIHFANPGLTNKVLLLRPLLWLGKVSYSMYMVQLFVIGIVWGTFQHHLFYKFSGLSFLENQFGDTFIRPKTTILIVACYVIFIVVLLFTSWILYITVENPFRKLSRSLANKIIT